MSAVTTRHSRPLRVLMVTSELAPYAHTGGLGDVASGLSLALATLGCDVLVVTPRYGVTRIPDSAGAHWWADPVDVQIGEGRVILGVLEATLRSCEHDADAASDVPAGSLRACFLDHPDLFLRDGIYGDVHGAFGDNDVRFAAMCRGALAVANAIWPDTSGEDVGPDIIHAHDWHAALSLVDAAGFGPSVRARAGTVFTIHNLAFQGVFAPDVLARIGISTRAFDDGPLAHDGQVNLLSGAIVTADRVTTVSPTYAREIRGRRDGFGLDGVLRAESRKLSGILNGIDVARFDPSTDGAIARRYDRTAPHEAKAECKTVLTRELDLDGDGPLFAIVSRLSEQKGIDLLLGAIPALVERGARFALVGAGDAHLEQALSAIANRFPNRVATRIAFDGDLARRIYAGADFFLVPSRYEPCGLTQLIAMRYGALPIVTPVGGLVDTVAPISALHGTGTGFVAESVHTASLLIACEDALALFADANSLRAAIERAMTRDSSWRAPATDYLGLYRALAG